DLLNLSRFPSLKTAFTEKFLQDLEGEIDGGVELLKHIVKESGAERLLFNGGNHEYRVRRALSNVSGSEKKILELKSVREAYSLPTLFRFNELGVKVSFPGEYPRGQWLV